jgi:hypothetical protein
MKKVAVAAGVVLTVLVVSGCTSLFSHNAFRHQRSSSLVE